jgi:hypothetical protein
MGLLCRRWTVNMQILLIKVKSIQITSNETKKIVKEIIRIICKKVKEKLNKIIASKE